MRIIDFASPRRMNEIMSLLSRVRDSLHMKKYILSEPIEENITTTT